MSGDSTAPATRHLASRPGGGSRRLDVLTSPLFLSALMLLVSNDLLLKALLPGGVTGKLSDFAGLFAFTVFWLALFPGRPLAVSAAIGTAFVVWKQPLSRPAVDFWNVHGPFAVGRVEDATDLWALIVIPLAILHVRVTRRESRSRAATIAVIFASVTAFAATSYRTSFAYGTHYVYGGEPSQFVAKLAELGIAAYPEAEAGAGTSYRLQIPATVCFGSIDGEIVVVSRDGATHIELLRLTHRCPEARGDKAVLLDVFQTAVVRPLALKQIRGPTQRTLYRIQSHDERG